jgi:gliding motility-associated-like protein
VFTDQVSFVDLDTASATLSPVSDTGCTGIPLLFQAATNSTRYYYWDFGDGSPPDSSLTVSHAYPSTGNYTVTFYLAGYCNADSIRQPVTVIQSCTAAFSFTEEKCTSQVVFDNTSSGGNAYVWHFGDGSTDTAFSPVHSYGAAGLYTVELIVNPGPCESVFTDQVKASASDSGGFFIPNVFTPDGDALNALFRIGGVNACSDYHCTVFNRWGKKMFESTADTPFWDGSADNSDASEGVYFYIIELDGKKYSGHVTLLRH